MTPAQKERFVGNIADNLQHAPREIQLRQLCFFFRADPSYGTGVANGLGIDLASLPNMNKSAVYV
jgi:catalase